MALTINWRHGFYSPFPEGPIWWCGLVFVVLAIAVIVKSHRWRRAIQRSFKGDLRQNVAQSNRHPAGNSHEQCDRQRHELPAIWCSDPYLPRMQKTSDGQNALLKLVLWLTIFWIHRKWRNLMRPFIWVFSSHCSKEGNWNRGNRGPLVYSGAAGQLLSYEHYYVLNREDVPV